MTPSHFLIGRSTNFQPHDKLEIEDTTVTQQDIISRQAVHEQLLEQFWSKWQSEYLRNLPPLQGKEAKEDINDGSVVLIQEDGAPRLYWPLGVITKLHKDKIVRAVDVKTAKSVITRPIQKVYILEIITSSNLPSMDKSRDESSLGQYKSDPNTETELTVQSHPVDHKSVKVVQKRTLKLKLNVMLWTCFKAKDIIFIVIHV